MPHTGGVTPNYPRTGTPPRRDSQAEAGYPNGNSYYQSQGNQSYQNDTRQSYGNQSDQFMSQEQEAEPAEDDAPADIPVWPGIFHKVVVEKEEIPEVAWLRYEYRGSGKNEDKNQWFRRPKVHYEWALSVKAWTLHHETKEKRDEMYQFCRMQGFKVIAHENKYIIDAASGNLEESKRKRQRYYAK
ncbi:hypothetical protein B9479_003937 [Cryptococcus floricola]|uniref:Uncharacterized protein n=1 Tax=Cryptococcus floricola TaxID=2591691 RepID=A0A5D3AY40_9TREE|nr:hypothetical protein B9479_003937 [Cryptococcus floricola]